MKKESKNKNNNNLVNDHSVIDIRTPGQHSQEGTRQIDTVIELKDVVITSNDPNNRSVRLPVYGKSIAPEITASPDFLDFGNVQVGSEANKQFTIANNGDAPLSGKITAPAGFKINSGSKYVKQCDNSLSYDIPVGESVIFDITFAPSLDRVNSDNNLELAPSSDTHLPEKKHRKKRWKKRKAYIYW